MFKSKLIAALAALTIASPAWAQLTLTGAGRIPSGVTYSALATHIASDFTAGTTSALSGVSDGSLGTVSFWLRAAPSNATFSNAGTTMLNGDFLSNQQASVTSETVPGFNISFDNSGGNYGTLRANLNDSTGGAGHNCNMIFNSLLVGGGWHHYLLEWDVSGATTSKRFTLYVDGVKQGAGGCSYTPGTAMSVHYANATGWNLSKPLGADPSINFEVSDIYVNFTASAVDASNNLSGAEIAKFYSSGAPVDITSLCSTATLCGRWSGSALAWTGTAASGITNTGTAWGASIAPGGSTTHKAYERWSLATMNASGVTTITTNAAGNTINTGDLLIATLGLVDTSTGTGNHSPTCPTGWTQVYVAWNNGSVNDPTDVLVCTHVAGASETGNYTFNWTTAPTRSSGWTLTDYANVNTAAGTNGVDVSAGTISGTSGTVSAISCPSVTTTQTNETVYCYAIWYAGGGTVTHAASQNELARQGSSNTGHATIDEYVASAGVVSARSQAVNASNSGQGVVLGIIPN